MPLARFHQAPARWFAQQLGQPTPAQAQAWPAIQSGRHTLIAAPTGSGKTLAAFYVAINELVEKGLRGELANTTQVIYVSPLKALGNDIQRNLQGPLAGITAELQRQGLALPEIRVGVRTGDTPQSERQKMLKKPPHILVTTPESLYLLLSSAGGRRLLGSATTLIVDEIHAMVGDKRGSHLSLSIARLEHLLPHRLQRIGLSATQKPVQRVARFLVGNGCQGCPAEECVIIDSGHRRKLDLSLEVPRSPMSALMSNDVWEELYERLVELIGGHETTLVFVNTRRLAERLALALQERLGEGQVSSHHGSMSKEHRHMAEQKLKSGQLRVLVATASMELGIDIGSVNLVVQFASPHSIAAFLQRVGRSGHQVGATSKGILFPLTRDDLVECTALLDSIRRGELDQIVMPEKPLDILAQHIVAEVGSLADAETGMGLDELYALCRASWVYRNLEQAEFEQIITMLAEGFSSRRGRRGAYLHLDQINRRVRPRGSARLTALTNGGAIPDMFDYQVVLDPEDIVVGSLNEDFALESLPGDIFSLGNHSWRLLRIDGLKVRVCDAGGQPPSVPFWFGEGPGRSRELSESVSRLRVEIRTLLDRSPSHEPSGAACDFLVREVGLQEAAAVQLVEYLKTGSDALGVMPSRDCLVMERFFDEVGDMHLVIHSPFGSRLNKAWGLALRKRFCRTFNFELQAAANEDSIVISLGAVHSFPLAEVFHYLKSATLQAVLIQALLDAPMFEVRWRWNATRALAIQRSRKGQRVPPQIQRMQAEDLVAQVFPDQLACLENIQGGRDVPDHPLVRQTLQDCLHEAMDVDELLELLKAIERNDIQLVVRDLREPSPFAQEIINARPYAFLDDVPFEERRTNAIRNRSWLDPAETAEFSTLDPQAIARVREEAWPLIRSAEELHDALLTMAYLTAEELSGGTPEHNAVTDVEAATDMFGEGEAGPGARRSLQVYLEPLMSAGRVRRLRSPGSIIWIAAERLPQFATLDLNWQVEPDLPLPAHVRQESWSRDSALREIIRGRLEGLGPVTAASLAASLGLPVAAIDMALLGLEAEGFVIRGRFSSSGAAFEANVEEWCERRLLQRIHRYTIDAHRESIKPVSLQAYLQYLFDLHGIQAVEDADAAPPRVLDHSALLPVLQRLDGYTAPAAAWEADILPARLQPYDPSWLDFLCISGKITWGRLLPPKQAGSSAGEGAASGAGKKAGPVKMTPLNIMLRENQALWRQLAVPRAAGTDARAPAEPAAANLGSSGRQILALLERHGASFFDDIMRLGGLLRAQVEEGLAELVSWGLVSSDSYIGLRALLAPASNAAAPGRRRRRPSAFGLAEAGRWSLTGRAGRPQPLAQEPESAADRQADNELDEEELEHLLGIYFNRWGVLSRRVLERESLAPPWRILLLRLRRMELRGEVRGGRFIAGVGGEQFALPATVKKLREFQRRANARESGESMQAPRHVVLTATDPLNLLGIILPDARLARVSGNRVLFEDGVPLAVLEKDQVRFLRDTGEDRQWPLQQMMQRRSFPPRLRSYLGRH